MSKYCRIVIADGSEFGLCLGTHTSWINAEEKRERDCAVRGYGAVAVIENPDSLSSGTSYPDLAQQYLDKCRKEKGVAFMLRVYEAREGDECIDRIASDIAVEGWTLKSLESEFGDQARQVIEEQKQAAKVKAEQNSRALAVQTQLSAERAEFTYTFPAVAGVQAGQQYFIAQVPYQQLVRLFSFDEEEMVPAELRAQRQLNERRAAQIGDYILKNPIDYVLPAITASVDSAMHFEAFQSEGTGGSLGFLHIPLDATLLINDGQHRRRGIEHAIKACKRLKTETVAVTLYFDRGLTRSQQMFSDINNNQVKPSSALNMVYDHRDPFASWIKRLLARPGMARIKARVDLESNSIGAKSSNLWSLIAFKKFIERFFSLTSRQFAADVGSLPLDEMAEEIEMFFGVLDDNLTHWKSMIDYSIPAPEVREKFIIGHAVFLEALGIVGSHVREQDGGCSERLTQLSKVAVGRVDAVWEGRCVIHGKMNKTTDGVKSTAAQICNVLGMKLPPEMAVLHERITGASAA